MYKVYDNWPQISRENFEKTYESVDFRFINHIVFAGMGGSGSLSDIFQALLSKSNVHVSIVKGYDLPKPIDGNKFILVVDDEPLVVDLLMSILEETGLSPHRLELELTESLAASESALLALERLLGSVKSGQTRLEEWQAGAQYGAGGPQP